MRTILWVAAWCAVGFWSLLAWGTYGFFGLFMRLVGGAGEVRVDGFPVEPGALAGLAGLLHGLGGFVLFLVWAAVAVFILGATWLLAALFTRRPKALPPAGPYDPGLQPGPGRAGAGSLFDRLDRFAQDRRPPPPRR